MYKYQKETLEYLEQIRCNLEKLTDGKMSLKIGTVRDEYLSRNGTKYYEETRELYFCINHNDGYIDTTFLSIGNHDKSYGLSDDCFLRLNSNLFLKLNDFIDKIYENKRERENFHYNLNKELSALNKAL